MTKTTTLEIPKHLRDAFLGILDSFLHEFLLDFGDDLTENELELVELLDVFVKTEKSADA